MICLQLVVRRDATPNNTTLITQYHHDLQGADVKSRGVNLFGGSRHTLTRSITTSSLIETVLTKLNIVTENKCDNNVLSTSPQRSSFAPTKSMHVKKNTEPPYHCALCVNILWKQRKLNRKPINKLPLCRQKSNSFHIHAEQGKERARLTPPVSCTRLFVFKNELIRFQSTAALSMLSCIDRVRMCVCVRQDKLPERK